jgi:hypothetical protein
MAIQAVGGDAAPDIGGVARGAGPQPVIQKEHGEPDPEQPADANEGLEQADGVGPTRDPHEDQLAGHE